jgi:hypothetical protein
MRHQEKRNAARVAEIVRARTSEDEAESYGYVTGGVGNVMTPDWGGTFKTSAAPVGATCYMANTIS